MGEIKSILIITIVTLFIPSYEFVTAHAGGPSVSPSAAASASASASGFGAVSAAASASVSTDASHAGGEFMENLGYVDVDTYNRAPREIEFVDFDAEAQETFRQNLLVEVNKHAYLYDRSDVDRILSDEYSVMKYLHQRNYDPKRAYKLAVDNLRWRAKNGISGLSAADFPCDLFSQGLIFESGQYSHEYDKRTRTYVQGGQVIWIRLKTLGNLVKELESLSPARLATSTYNAARKATRKIKKDTKRMFGYRDHVQRPPIMSSRSVENDSTIQLILKSIVWWLDDWEQRHPPGTQATLVLDFEDSADAFSSFTIGEFFIKLDDLFPAMFDRIIGFRFKVSFWSVKDKLSMFNRIFKSRFVSSVETDRKLKFVSRKPQLSKYMPSVDERGFSMLPPHVSGIYDRPLYQVPYGCQAEPMYYQNQG